MARLGTNGWEWREGNADGSGTVSGLWSYDTTTVHNSGGGGSVSLKGTFAGSSNFITSVANGNSVSLGRTYFWRAWVQFHNATALSGNGYVVAFGGNWGLALDTTGVIRPYSGGAVNTTVGTVTYTPPMDTWILLEVSTLVNTGSVDTLAWRVGGVLQESLTGLTLSDTMFLPTIGAGFSDSLGGNVNVWYDDLALNDDQGSAQNSWPGDGRVVLLKPISDSAVGTGWTLGTGTAISANSGSTAVKNTPPVGVADLTAGSDTKQIRNATSNANVNYDANLTTYTTAGIGASDTVNVLVPMVATGAPVVTSAKQGTFGVSSNPAITNVALGAGGTAGAFWSGVAAGTYPTGWKWSFGTTTYAPTVTVGSSPVARITQVTSSTRIADVCAMGMYVDYTPATTKAPPFQRRTARNSLLRR